MLTKNKTTTRGELLLKNLLKIENKKSKMLVTSGADPWIIYQDGWYYYCRVMDDWQILVNKSRRLEDVGKHNHVVWRHSSGRSDTEVWAPELHFLNGKWYIYFTMGKATQHRMYVLEARTENPQGAYELKGKITDPTDLWAIDGTIMELRQKLYFVWSGWEGGIDVRQNLYIAPMSNPWTISGERVLISTPQYDWEKSTTPGLVDVNEGPEILQHNGHTFIIYSASHSLTNDYCLGQLTLVADNPLLKSSWIKHPGPVFYKTNTAFGPGHASFTTMPNGSDWIIYHTARFSGAGWDRQVLAQKYSWHIDGSPNFGVPLPIKKQLFFIKTSRAKQSSVAI